jgi:hypothetical protein
VTAHILAIDTAANYSQIKLATCSPAFDGENPLTDRQYTPAVSQSVTAATQFSPAGLRVSLQLLATASKKPSQLGR